MKGLPQLVIRKFRTTYGIGQADFADKLGVSQSLVQRWEHGLDVPAPAVLSRIHDVIIRSSTDPNLVLLRETVAKTPKIMCTVTGEDLDMRVASEIFTQQYGDKHLTIPWARMARREGTELAIDLFRNLLKRRDLCQCHMEVEVDTWNGEVVTGHCTGTRFEFDGTPMLVLDIEFYGPEELERKGGIQGSYTSFDDLKLW